MGLEMIGITLAYIEIRYKPLANRIENKILTEEGRIMDFAFKLLKNKFFSALITVFVTIVFFIEIPYLVGFFDKIVPKEWNNVKETIIWSTFPIISSRHVLPPSTRVLWAASSDKTDRAI
jgi:hypothetical protein